MIREAAKKPLKPGLPLKNYLILRLHFIKTKTRTSLLASVPTIITYFNENNDKCYGACLGGSEELIGGRQQEEFRLLLPMLHILQTHQLISEAWLVDMNDDVIMTLNLLFLLVESQPAGALPVPYPVQPPPLIRPANLDNLDKKNYAVWPNQPQIYSSGEKKYLKSGEGGGMVEMHNIYPCRSPKSSKGRIIYQHRRILALGVEADNR